MAMQEKPEIFTLPDGGKYWTHSWERFRVLVYVPVGDPRAQVINFGFQAPYLLVFGSEGRSIGDAIDYAERRGLADIARQHSGSVVFALPNCEGGWENAPDSLFEEIIAESKIQQYYEDGLVRIWDRFARIFRGWHIRGAVFRTMLFGTGSAADYLARHCLKTLQGEYLWGPGEITPVAVTLEKLSVLPAVERRDLWIVSVGNSDAVNQALQASCDHVQIRQTADYRADAAECWGRYKRWCGVLTQEESLPDAGMTETSEILTVHTSPDNRGDHAGSATHPAGVMVYARQEALRSGAPLPLVLAFHGGGDSALHMAWVSGWWRVAMRNNFLLVCPENHLNLTATEVMELIGCLKEKYPVDSRRIYATGFSMGGCKTWDLYQEYPEDFAAMAPMDATFEVGLNQYGEKAPKEINQQHPVPLFYAAGEETPLPEMPCQAEKCLERIRYVFRVNQVRRPYDLTFENRANWPERFWGVPGDRITRIPDPSRGSVLTLHAYDSADGVCRTVLAGVDHQGHECREHTCEQAWQFMRQFVLPE